jgi:hypothetical protein
VLDWDDVVASPDPYRSLLELARSAFQHSCLSWGWNPALPNSMEGTPPPVM